MCVQISIQATVEELQEAFSYFDSYIEFEPIHEGYPLQKFPVYTNSGFQELVWGKKEEKLEIHKLKNELKSKEMERGILAATGFVLFKTEKAPAPIGFGDHKERITIKKYYLKKK